jgi:hypothetical protein
VHIRMLWARRGALPVCALVLACAGWGVELLLLLGLPSLCAGVAEELPDPDLDIGSLLQRMRESSDHMSTLHPSEQPHGLEPRGKMTPVDADHHLDDGEHRGGFGFGATEQVTAAASRLREEELMVEQRSALEKQHTLLQEQARAMREQRDWMREQNSMMLAGLLKVQQALGLDNESSTPAPQPQPGGDGAAASPSPLTERMGAALASHSRTIAAQTGEVRQLERQLTDARDALADAMEVHKRDVTALRLAMKKVESVNRRIANANDDYQRQVEHVKMLHAKVSELNETSNAHQSSSTQLRSCQRKRKLLAKETVSLRKDLDANTARHKELERQMNDTAVRCLKLLEEDKVTLERQVNSTTLRCVQALQAEQAAHNITKAAAATQCRRECSENETAAVRAAVAGCDAECAARLRHRDTSACSATAAAAATEQDDLHPCAAEMHSLVKMQSDFDQIADALHPPAVRIEEWQTAWKWGFLASLNGSMGQQHRSTESEQSDDDGYRYGSSSRQSAHEAAQAKALRQIDRIHQLGQYTDTDVSDGEASQQSSSLLPSYATWAQRVSVELQSFYREHNADFLVGGQIAKLLREYKGAEGHMLRMLREQYGGVPDVEAWAVATEDPPLVCREPGVYTFGTEAKVACLQDSGCESIYDVNCDSIGEWWTCRAKPPRPSSSGSLSELSSAPESCKYIKPNQARLAATATQPKDTAGMEAEQESTNPAAYRLTGATMQVFNGAYSQTSSLCLGKPVYIQSTRAHGPWDRLDVGREEQQRDTWYTLYLNNNTDWMVSTAEHALECSSTGFLFSSPLPDCPGGPGSERRRSAGPDDTKCAGIWTEWTGEVWVKNEDLKVEADIQKASKGRAVMGGADNADALRARVTEFYQKHNPSKLPKVEAILFRYRGRETELLRDLTSKYVSV